MTSKGRTPESQQQHHEEGGSVFRIPPYHYIHVLDQTSNVTRIELGPNTFIRKDNEKVILRPTKMVIVPPGCYCSVTNPAKKDKSAKINPREILRVRHPRKLIHAKINLRENLYL